MTKIAIATPRSAHDKRCSRGASDAQRTNTSRYASNRTNSMNARPWACDQPPDSSIHVARSASAAATTPLQALKPAKGRDTVVTLTARAIAARAATGAQADGKTPPAWNASSTTRAPGSRAGRTARARRTLPIFSMLLARARNRACDFGPQPLLEAADGKALGVGHDAARVHGVE